MLKNFFIGNTVVLVCTGLGYKIFIDRKRESLYKNTRAFDLVMSTLRSNEGAIHFLGENIKDGRLKVLEEKKSNNITVYRVKVQLEGSKAKGCMNFWLHQTGEEPDVELTRIELQIQNIKNRLLIFEGNKSTKDTNEVPYHKNHLTYIESEAVLH